MSLLSLIVAVADNGVIGVNNGLPWRIRSEMQYFKATTLGHPVIMGRKSFDSLGKALPGRLNIVITRDKNFSAPDIAVTHDANEAIKKAGDAKEIFVIGGAEIYRLLLPQVQKVYLTHVHMKPEGNAFFPALNADEWTETKREFHAALPGESADYTITVLDRKS